MTGYLVSLNVFDLGLLQSRTAATSTLILVGLYLIVVLEASGRRRGTAVIALCLALAALYVVVLLVPFARSFFALAQPTLASALIAAGGCLVAIGGLVLSSDKFVPGGASRGR